ncbi:hypothetical protein T492DRAFT_1096259 [Pavlovales sp. CCMP2436]|nr:hypothetical protein T492DRAFT_1096259 [Pavlovales sp. CCMP2436]
MQLVRPVSAAERDALMRGGVGGSSTPRAQRELPAARGVASQAEPLPGSPACEVPASS